MAEVPNRVFGTEMEWPVEMSVGDGPLTRDDEGRLTEAIIRNCLPDGILRLGSSGMMTNGARLYQDLRFIEYATPEDNNLESVVANEIAGERIIRMVLERAVRAEKISAFVVNKRVIDDIGNTWGYHASLSADGKKINQNAEFMIPLGMHLATHSIYAGAGAIWHHGYYQGENAVYALAQKVAQLRSDYGGSSHGVGSAGPLVNLKSENHSHDGSLRIHQSSMDANISPWATWMKLGVTSIVLRLMEEGYRGDDLKLMHSDTMHQLAIDIAADQSLKHSVVLETGVRMRAIDVQKRLYKRACNINLSDDEMKVMPEWERALDNLDEDPERMNGLVDWLIRRRVIRRMMDKHDLPIYDPRVASVDRIYDNTDPDIGIGMLLRSKGVMNQWMPEEHEIENAITNAPSTTRAKTRADLIRKYYHNETIMASWDYVKMNNETKWYVFKSPLQIEPTEYDYKPKLNNW